MTTSDSRPQDRLSKWLTRFGAWLRGSSRASAQAESDQPRQPVVPLQRADALTQSAEGARGTSGARPAEAAAAPIRDPNRKTVDSDEYGGANLVRRIRPPSNEASTQPARATPKEVWSTPSSVDPTPVWYKVAGYEDKLRAEDRPKDKDQSQSQDEDQPQKPPD